MTAAATAGRRALALFEGARSRPLLLGIVNATPDSFYPESRKPSAEAAVAAGLQLLEQGADALDIGGQSTRPGSEPVSLEEELRRVVPVVDALVKRAGAVVSVDTDKAEVARQAREAGAVILNDVSAFRADPAMLAEAVRFEACIVMHIGGGGTPKTMQHNPSYVNVVEEVRDFLAERKAQYLRAGGAAARLVFDPGIGFGKTLEHNLSLLKHLSELSALGPVALGVSRKSFIGRVVPDAGPAERLEGSLAAACWAALSGVRVLRVHDVLATRKALEVLAAIKAAR